MNRHIGFMFGACLAVAISGLSTGVSAQSASQLDPGLNTVALWQTSNGNWRACGPQQCIQTSYSNLEEAFDLVAPDPVGGYVMRGSIGNCTMYQSGTRTPSYHNSAQWVLDRASC